MVRGRGTVANDGNEYPITSSKFSGHESNKWDHAVGIFKLSEDSENLNRSEKISFGAMINAKSKIHVDCSKF